MNRVEGKNSIYAELVEHSVNEFGNELMTFRLHYPRIIHAEIMTHRMFCLDGDSMLEFDLPKGQDNSKSKRIYKMKLSEFANKWIHGDSLGRTLRHRLSVMNIRQLNEDTNNIQSCNIKDAVYSGKKEVFEIQTDNFSVSGSKDHKILTTDGWKCIKDLIIGEDYIITKSVGVEDKNKTDELKLKKINGKWKSTWLNQIRKSKLNDQNELCYDCGVGICDLNELHHDIPVYQDKSLAFEYGNIVALCPDCHNKRHSTQDWQVSQYLYGFPELLNSKESKGIKDTYDLEMDSDYENFIADGIVVHNSRNASSSRAIPVNKILEQVRENPAMPVKFGKNKSGMQDDGEHDAKIQVEFWSDYDDDMVTDYYGIEEFWEMSAESASRFAEAIADVGYHKQIANRLLEPYQYMNTIVSMTDIDNFWHLRLHSDADPTFVELASCMKEAYDNSTPTLVRDGDYHLPFIEKKFDMDGVLHYYANEVEVDLNTAIKVSISICCQVSYRLADFSIEKAIKIWDMLVTMNPVHASPLEHVAKPFSVTEWEARDKIQGMIEDNNIIGVNAMYCGNFNGWEQYRKTVLNENVELFTGEWV